MRCKRLYLLVFTLVQGCATVAPGPSVRPDGDSGAAHPQRAEALLQALTAVGVAYRNAGDSHANGFDCSGLVAYVYREAWGIALPRNAKAQSEFGVAITRAELEPGDLVFYNTLNAPFSHVGIYLGDGRFVHAPRQGAHVRTDSMDSVYWTRRFDGARRIQRY